jgi:hypothetical protein
MYSTTNLQAPAPGSSASLRTRTTARLPAGGALATLAYAAGRAAEPMRCGPPECLTPEQVLEQGQHALTALDEATAALTEAAPGGALFDAEADPIADLVVIGVWTLQRKRAALETILEGGDVPRVCEAAASARRASIRALAALEGALLGDAADLGVVARLLAVETERALHARGLYRAFRAALRAETTPTAARVGARLSAVGGALSRVFASPHWDALRAEDRRLFREIEERVHAFRATDEHAGTVGLRLWQDIAAFAGCLRAINNRPELVEHDGRVAASVLDHIPADDDALVDDGVLEALGALLGRDDSLDELLLGRGGARAGALRLLLDGIARR